MQTIQFPSKRPTSPHPVLNLGFRIFFLGSAIFAILTMLKWSHITFATQFAFGQGDMLPYFWHGHEMVYGYAVAVIAGFLLTAVKTWTNQPMPYGWKLLAIFMPWAFARLIFLINGIHLNTFTIMAGALDLLFWFLVIFFVSKPIWTVRQTRQIGIIAKLLLLFIGQSWFYWAIFTNSTSTHPYMSLLFGFYLVIGVVLTIGRRVMPMFIERGIAEGGAVKETVKNSTLLDRLSLASFFVFFLTDIFLMNYGFGKYMLSISALIVAITNGLRLKNWNLSGIWSRPLLWSLWLSFAGMVVGFFLFALVPFTPIKHGIAFHAVALSGVGLITLAMMSRVTLGHTGRSVHQPPTIIGWICGCMVVAWVARVWLGMIPNFYQLSLGISQGFWVITFVLFVATYGKILLSPRTDGLFG